MGPDIEKTKRLLKKAAEEEPEECEDGQCNL